jgi:hypothetical protein
VATAVVAAAVIGTVATAVAVAEATAVAIAVGTLATEVGAETAGVEAIATGEGVIAEEGTATAEAPHTVVVEGAGAARTYATTMCAVAASVTTASSRMMVPQAVAEAEAEEATTGVTDALMGEVRYTGCLFRTRVC